jgi:hypothetical protein
MSTDDDSWLRRPLAEARHQAGARLGFWPQQPPQQDPGDPPREPSPPAGKVPAGPRGPAHGADWLRDLIRGHQ